MKDKIISLSFVAFLLIFSLLSLLTPDKEVSIKERRKLASIPEITIKSLLNGTYFEKVDDYILDQAPMRDNFRGLKSFISKKIFMSKEDNGILETQNHLFNLDATLNESSVNYFLTKINSINQKYVTSNNAYFIYIPDKNYYLNDKNVPKKDYNKFMQMVNQNLASNIQKIDILDTLSLDNYYRTDIHWKQETLEKTLNKIASNMNIFVNMPNITNTFSPFYGALYGSTISNIKPDTITYLSSDIINNSTVYNYEKKLITKVYNNDNLNDIDRYDIYLSGATSLLIINNKNAQNNKELVVFRDSFASSLVPLLIPAYSKITMIDLRYLSSKYLDKIPEININSNTDILFIYSMPVINNSFALK